MLTYGQISKQIANLKSVFLVKNRGAHVLVQIGAICDIIHLVVKKKRKIYWIPQIHYIFSYIRHWRKCPSVGFLFEDVFPFLFACHFKLSVALYSLQITFIFSIKSYFFFPRVTGLILTLLRAYPLSFMLHIILFAY